MEINVVDTVDRGLVTMWRQLASLNQDPIEIKNGPDGVKRMVDEVTQKAKTPNSIDVLRILAHGNSGAIAVTGGDSPSDPNSLIAIWNLPKLEPELKRLTPYFKPNARVELLGCYVATKSVGEHDHIIEENSDGEKFIKQLAKIWNVNVLASGNTNRGLPIASIKFVGLVVQANPSGGLACVPAPEITKIN